MKKSIMLFCAMFWLCLADTNSQKDTRIIQNEERTILVDPNTEKEILSKENAEILILNSANTNETTTTVVKSVAIPIDQNESLNNSTDVEINVNDAHMTLEKEASLQAKIDAMQINDESQSLNNSTDVENNTDAQRTAEKEASLQAKLDAMQINDENQSLNNNICNDIEHSQNEEHPSMWWLNIRRRCHKHSTIKRNHIRRKH